MSEWVTGAIRIVHIGSAIGLAGAGFLWTLVIAPTLTRSLPGPRVGEIMDLLGPRMGRYLSILAAIVFLSGATLLGSIWGWHNIPRILFGGELYGLLILLGIVAFFGGVIVGEGIIMPTGKRLATLGPSTPPALIQRLQRRQAIAFVVVSVLDLVALSMMALGVNARA